MRSFVAVLVSLLTTEVSATVTGQLYSSAGLDNKSFADNIVFTSRTISLVHCAALCHQHQSCVTFTLQGDECQGHSVKVTPTTPSTYSAGARSYAEVSRKSECESSDGGVVTIYPVDKTPLQVYCDSDTDGGGWLVFQRRQDGSVDFYRNWTEYQQGFGDLNGEFWLGLDALHTLTSHRSWDLRVDLMKWDGTTGYASYSNFSISDSSDNYRLHLDSFTGGNAGDGLSYVLNREFSTYDADHDSVGDNCALNNHGAWWYRECNFNSLNGRYYHHRQVGWDTIIWWRFEAASLKFAEMKMRAV